MNTYLRSMLVLRIQIGFVSCLDSDEVVPKDSLTLFHYFEAPVGAVIKRYTKVPVHIDKSRNIAHHLYQVWCKYKRRGLRLQKAW